jgi:hypothetical protein
MAPAGSARRLKIEPYPAVSSSLPRAHALQPRRPARLRKSPIETRPWLHLIVLRRSSPASSSSRPSPLPPPYRPPAAPQARRPGDCRSSSPSGEVAATTATAAPAMAMLPRTSGWRGCYNCSATLLQRVASPATSGIAPACSAAIHGARPAPPSPPLPRPQAGPQARPAKLQPLGGGAPVLQGAAAPLRAGATVLLVVVGVATRGWWPCYFVASTSATKADGGCYKGRRRGDDCYNRGRCLLRRPVAAATKGGGATTTATIGVGVCYEGRRLCLLQGRRGVLQQATAAATKGGDDCYKRRRRCATSLGRRRRGTSGKRRRPLLQTGRSCAARRLARLFGATVLQGGRQGRRR